MNTTVVDLMRHGEPEGGMLLRGSTDHPLSPAGWKQMRDAVKGLSGWTHIVSSPLSRCCAFAEELSDLRGVPVDVHEKLSEIHFGDWEGRSMEEVHQAEPERLAAFWADPLNNTPPAAEPLRDFRRRVLTAWQDILRRHVGEHLLITAHGGVNRIIMAEVLGMPLENLFRIEVPYACLTRIVVDREGGEMHSRLARHRFP